MLLCSNTFFRLSTKWTTHLLLRYTGTLRCCFFYSCHLEVSFRAFQSHVTYQEIQLSLQKLLHNELIVCYNFGACSIAISNLKRVPFYSPVLYLKYLHLIVAYFFIFPYTDDSSLYLQTVDYC